MNEAAVDVTYRTVLRHCEGLLEWAQRVGYDVHGPGIKLKDDWHVSFCKSVYCGRPCYFVRWSAIEHIWVNPHMRFFHGSRRAEAIVTDGFDIEAPRTTDPGDFGWGVYLTDRVARARCHGEVLAVDVDTSRFAYIPSPYFIDGFDERTPETDVERLFYDLAFKNGKPLLIVGSQEQRVAIAKAIRSAFIEAGYDGILSAPDRMGQVEAVVFHIDAIQSVSRRSQPDTRTNGL